MTTKRTRRYKPTWQDDVVLESGEDKLSFADTIDLKLVSLSLSLTGLLPNISYADFEQDMNNLVDDGQVTDCTMSDEWTNYISENNSDRQLNLYKLSFIYCILAKRAYEDAESDKARSLIEKASYFSDLFDAVAEAEASKNSAEDRRKGRSKGGNTTSNIRYKTAKNEAIRLLKEKCPDGRWDNISSAIKEITGGMESFIGSNFITLDLDELPRTLRRWIKTDPDVSAAYNALSAKTPLKSKPKKKSHG